MSERKTERIVARVTPSMKAKLEITAKADNRSIANMLEILIEEAYQKHLKGDKQ